MCFIGATLIYHLFTLESKVCVCVCCSGMFYRPFDIKRRVDYGIKHRNVDNTAVDQIKPLMSSHSVLYPNLGPSGSRIHCGGKWPTTNPAYGGHSQENSPESSYESIGQRPSYYKV